MCKTNFSLDSTYFISLRELSFSSKQSNLLYLFSKYLLYSLAKQKKHSHCSHIKVHLCNTPFRIIFPCHDVETASVFVCRVGSNNRKKQ